MISIRFHGRGGQGMKTAGHMLGNAFFLAGYEVQDAPRYGAERRGAPMTAYVRADRRPIFERGVVRRPGLVVVADDSLVPVAAAGVMEGIAEDTVLLLVSSACAGAAAALCGGIDAGQLEAAVRQEMEKRPAGVAARNVAVALATFERFGRDRGIVDEEKPQAADDYTSPDWIDLPLETAELSAPVIHARQTSVMVRTGLWCTRRPVIDPQRCNRCWWICSSSCPDGVINIVDNRPVIDYEHCKGCMICVAQCPAHAIASVPETRAQQEEKTCNAN